MGGGLGILCRMEGRRGKGHNRDVGSGWITAPPINGVFLDVIINMYRTPEIL
jgi:hypothetical protein